MDTTLQRALREHGLRMTPQRQLVLDAVRELGRATPGEICAHVQRSTPAVNITTIYRTLYLLEGLELVRHAHLGHGAPSYSTRPHEHVHDRASPTHRLTLSSQRRRGPGTGRFTSRERSPR